MPHPDTGSTCLPIIHSEIEQRRLLFQTDNRRLPLTLLQDQYQEIHFWMRPLFQHLQWLHQTNCHFLLMRRPDQFQH